MRGSGHDTRTGSLGLTVLEVIVAIAILGIVTAVLATALVSSVQHNAVSGQRTQGVQVLNYLGRLVIGGDGAVLPAAGESLSWDYGQLTDDFPDLATGAGAADPGLYKAAIRSAGTVTLDVATAVQYDISVCYQRAGGEHCVQGTTLGPSPSAGGAASSLPDIY